MPQAKTAIGEHISKALHMQYEKKKKKHLRKRWIDLIRYLNEMDAKRAEPTERKIQKN